MNDIVFNRAYIDTDTIKYQRPEDLYIEHPPAPIEINSQFGEYEASFTIEG